MLKRFILILLIVFWNSPFANAAIVVNEIMYDLDGADIDYVEVKNNGSEDVDLSTLKLLISNSTSNHSINFSSGNSILHGEDIGIIVATSALDNYISKWGSVGNIFTSSFSLPNSATESTKVEINAGEKEVPISSATYSSLDGASGDGNSLQLINGSWVSTLPTPAIENQNSSSTQPAQENTSDSTSNNSNGGGSSSASSGSSSTTFLQPAIKVKIVTKNVVFAGVAFPLKAAITGYYGEEVHSGKYFWNFGDGDSMESNNDSSFNHTYLYPGDYSASLEYYLNIYSQIPETIEKVKIKVVPLELSISKVGDEKDFFIELTNNSSYDIDVSLWQVSSLGKVFTLPRNTNILAKNKITLSSQLTHFNINNKEDLKLLTPHNKIVFEYGKNTISVNNIVKNKEEGSSKSLIQPVLGKINEIQNDNFSASLVSSVDSPVESAVTEDVDINNSENVYIWLVLAGLFIVGGGAVYLIHGSKSSSLEDFEILDE